MDTFWIKLFVLLVLAALFVVTVWVTPRLFTRANPKGGAPGEPALDPGARTGDP